MKKITILFLISLFLLGCNLPFTIKWNSTPTTEVETVNPTEDVQPTESLTEVPTEAITVIPTEAPTEPPVNGTELNLGGIHMVLPPCLATNTVMTPIEAVPYDEMNGPMEYYPANRKITFQGYPLSGKFFAVDDPNKLGGLVIYPAEDYAAMNQYMSDELSSMQTLLANKPSTPDSIPVLGIFGAMSVFKAQMKYIDFQNGQGIRFLTEYAQYNAPVNNNDLFYTFQGLTSDGKYWISAIFPVNATYLQASSESTEVPDGGLLAPSFDDPNYVANFITYYSDMINKLNTTPDAEFNPGLDCLDQFIQSLTISD
jgi:hypothetical protein